MRIIHTLLLCQFQFCGPGGDASHTLEAETGDQLVFSSRVQLGSCAALQMKASVKGWIMPSTIWPTGLRASE